MWQASRAAGVAALFSALGCNLINDAGRFDFVYSTCLPSTPKPCDACPERTTVCNADGSGYEACACPFFDVFPSEGAGSSTLAVASDGSAIIAGAAQENGARFGEVRKVDAGGGTVWTARSDMIPQRVAVVPGSTDVIEAGWIPRDPMLQVAAVRRLDGNTGNVVWSREGTGKSSTFASVSAVDFDASGDLLLVGIHYGPVSFAGVEWSTPGTHGFIVALDSGGNHLWDLEVGGSGLSWLADCAATGGELVISGGALGEVAFPGVAPKTTPLSGVPSPIVVHFDLKSQSALSLRACGGALAYDTPRLTKDGAGKVWFSTYASSPDGKTGPDCDDPPAGVNSGLFIARTDWETSPPKALYPADDIRAHTLTFDDSGHLVLVVAASGDLFGTHGRLPRDDDIVIGRFDTAKLDAPLDARRFGDARLQWASDARAGAGQELFILGVFQGQLSIGAFDAKSDKDSTSAFFTRVAP